MASDPLVRRFLLRNPDLMKDEELLELLLRFTENDAASISTRLLTQYKNIANLMEADVNDLLTFDFLDEETVLLLRLVPELHRRYFIARLQGEERLRSSASFGKYLLPYFYGARDEMVYLLCLDGGGKVINCYKIGHGSVNSADVSVRKLAQYALHANATAVVLAHNHPSGINTPSTEDIDLTNYLKEVLVPLDITLLDHIIIANDNYVSLRESGYFGRF